MKSFLNIKTVALATTLLFGRGVYADTVLDFNGAPPGQFQDSPLLQSFGDNAGVSSPGITVSSGGTPDIALAWRAFGATQARWDYYNDTLSFGLWPGVAQLNDAQPGAYYDLVLTPRNSTRVVINSFVLRGYIPDQNERFTIGWEVWSGDSLRASGTVSFTGITNQNVTVNYTGAVGEELVLSLNRLTSTLSGGEYEGLPENLAVDDLSFSQINVAETPAAGPAEYARYVLRDGPLAYYRLSETAAPTETAVNIGSVGAAANGTHTFNVLSPYPGAIVGTTDGSTRYDWYNPEGAGNPGGAPTLIPNTPEFNTIQFSVEGWVKPTIEGRADAAAPLMNRVSNDGFGGRQGWVFFQRAANGQTPPDGNGSGFNFRMYQPGTGSTSINITGGSYDVNQWTHIAATYDGTTARLYVNGVEVASGNTTSYAPNTLQSLAIGSYSELLHAFDYQNPFVGFIDEVALYSNVLSASQLLAHYQNGTNAARATPYQTLVLADGPVGYYRLNEGTVAVNSGSLGSLANGIYNNTANGVLGPKPATFLGFESTNRAAGFDGIGSYINLGNPAGLNFSGPISLEAWIKPATVQGAFANIIAHGVGPTGVPEVVLRITDDNRYQVSSWDGANHGTEFLLPAEDQTGTNWVHIVGTYDGTNWNLFRNGVLVASSPDAVGAIPVNDADWAIGSSGDNAFTFGTRTYDGAIDEVAIYDYALSPEQALVHYVVGVNGPLLSIAPSGGSSVTLSWPAGTLLESTNVHGPYTPVLGATPPSLVVPATGQKFYRVGF